MYIEYNDFSGRKYDTNYLTVERLQYVSSFDILVKSSIDSGEHSSGGSGFCFLFMR